MAIIGSLTFSLEGDKELEQFFRSLGKAMAGKIIRRIARDATKVSVEAIRKATPKRRGKTAKNSLYVRADKRKKRGMIQYVIGFKAEEFQRKNRDIRDKITGLITRRRKGLRGIVNKVLRYAKKTNIVKKLDKKNAGKRRFHPWMIEFGTSKRPAKPFFRSAWESSKSQAIGYWRREIRSFLNKANASKNGNGPLLLPD